jgi:hypothetical protein
MAPFMAANAFSFGQTPHNTDLSEKINDFSLLLLFDRNHPIVCKYFALYLQNDTDKKSSSHCSCNRE